MNLKPKETLYQELLDKAVPLLEELSKIIVKYPHGVATVGLATAITSHAKTHGHDPYTWLTLLLRAGLCNWTAEEVIEAVDDIRVKLHEGYSRLSEYEGYTN